MNKLICAFPTMGKTTISRTSLYPGEFVDLELGELSNLLYHRKVKDFDKYSLEFQNLLKVYEFIIQTHVHTSTVLIAWPQYSASMLKRHNGIILLPSYPQAELVDRLRRRGSSPTFVYDMIYHLDDYLGQWNQVAAEFGIKVEYADSVQNYLDRCSLQPPEGV